MNSANRARNALCSLVLGTAVATFATPAGVLAKPDQRAEVQVGTGMICDTQQQIERLAILLDNGPQEAALKVNTEEKNPNACGYATIAYVQGSSMGTARNKQGAFKIVQIMVVGVGTEKGMQAVSPTGYFSLVKIEEIEV